jgi:hypothetical protein
LICRFVTIIEEQQNGKVYKVCYHSISMKMNDISIDEKPVISVETPEITTSGSELTKVGLAKLNALKNSVEDINILIEEREDLSEDFIEEGEEVKTEINNFLLENENTTEFEKADLMKEKNLLRSKKIEISEIQMKEKIDSWKDIALLKKELRLQEQEISEREERMNSITKLLDEDI